MTKKFQRKIEEFTCNVCNRRVKGNGYTDHCPECLWGKHVDINPGDRKAKCHGAMKPIDFEEKSGQIRLKYQCQKCSHIFWVKTGSGDNYEKIINIKVDL